MDFDPTPGDLVDHLSNISPLEREEANRLVLEIVAYFSESPESFVIRRHRELRADGQPNLAIYKRIATELGARRFPAPCLSQRQIRRLIYG